ncbi:hypothetical protein F4677DRAFT_235557 [Hypoxylon crocopeplum]|nr:hypothetical protein F4677DRAFT_235557 [Hypoxylon crocopeplum]
MESANLYDIGNKVFGGFEGLLSLDASDQLPGHHHLASEAQRFRLWAHSLGLHQQGHASLDYRVRDAIIVKVRLAEILSELQAHLDNLLAIAKRERLPFEQETTAGEDADSDDTDSTKSDTESFTSAKSHATSESSFHEVDFRLQSLTESLDGLYSLATKIRNPRNRPQRTNNQLYKRVPADVRTSFIKEREEAEIAVIAYAQRQQLIDGVDHHEAANLQLSSEQLIDQYATTTHWLVRRTGIANARRKQQFVYWKNHALRLSQAPQSNSITPVAEKSNDVPKDEPITIPQNEPVPDGGGGKTTLAPLPSLATSATRLDADFVKLDDLKSVISHQSRVSTVMNLQGEKLEWPAPPMQTMSGRYFTCPHCMVLCPRRYLARDAWHVHLIHDLQPYHCTYQDCQDSHRLYGTRQDWIDHESQHSRVWHCQSHTEEFETQPEYIEHLKTLHPEAMSEYFSPELVAAVVGPSLKPHRDCPFCPTAFSKIADMQKHITFHLERFALLALPPITDDSDGDDSDRPSDSHEPQRRGRQDSAVLDFDGDDETSFKDITYRPEGGAYGQTITKPNLQEIPPITGPPGVIVDRWIRFQEKFTNLPVPPDEPLPEDQWPSEYKEAKSGRRDTYVRNRLDYKGPLEAPTRGFFPWLEDRPPAENFRRPAPDVPSERYLDNRDPPLVRNYLPDPDNTETIRDQLRRAFPPTWVGPKPTQPSDDPSS